MNKFPDNLYIASKFQTLLIPFPCWNKLNAWSYAGHPMLYLEVTIQFRFPESTILLSKWISWQSLYCCPSQFNTSLPKLVLLPLSTVQISWMMIVFPIWVLEDNLYFPEIEFVFWVNLWINDISWWYQKVCLFTRERIMFQTIWKPDITVCEQSLSIRLLMGFNGLIPAMTKELDWEVVFL